jgi:uncharacterized membrane protein
MSAAGAALALAAPHLDATTPYAYTATRTDALALLGMILTSMITMASLVFSLTLVALTLAASQFGPRLIRTYMARRQTQLILGTYALTIVFCLLLVARIGRMPDDAVIAPASLPLATGLTLLSVLLLILHTHTLARSMLSETIIDLEGAELEAGIAALGPFDDASAEDPEALLPPDVARDAHRTGVPRQGYVQAIDFGALVKAAQEAGVLVAFRFRPGDYLIAHGREIAVHPAGRVTPALEDSIGRAFALGPYRTPVQDPAFSIRHLVEIGARALSHAVNDPYTAVAVIDRLSGSLARLMTARLPPGVFRDADGAVRVLCERPTWASLLGGAFDQLRQNGADKPLVAIHLAEAVARVAETTVSPAQTKALRHELRLLADAAEARIDAAHDRAAVAARVAAATEALDAAERAIRAGCR